MLGRRRQWVCGYSTVSKVWVFFHNTGWPSTVSQITQQTVTATSALSVHDLGLWKLHSFETPTGTEQETACPLVPECLQSLQGMQAVWVR